MKAIGDIETCKDKCLKKFLLKAEKLFQPKKIYSQSDWLIDHPEKSQSFEEYIKPGEKNAVTKQRNKIYINIIDSSIPQDFLQKLILYCEAFYTGMTVQVMIPE